MERTNPILKRGKTLRVMTYNVHSCIGMDGVADHERIARVIKHYAPDVVALQELETGRDRTGGLDQAHLIAHDLEMMFHFHPSIEVEEEKYGDAILSTHPMELIRAGELPGLRWKWLEPRGALWVRIDFHGRPFHVLNTHLSLHFRERLIETRALLGPDWLGHPDCTGHRIMCGDFNAGPLSPVCRRFRRILRDAQEEHETHRPKRTFYSTLPFSRIDHVFVERDLDVARVEVPSTELTRVASDHLPLIVDVRTRD